MRKEKRLKTVKNGQGTDLRGGFEGAAEGDAEFGKEFTEAGETGNEVVDLCLASGKIKILRQNLTEQRHIYLIFREDLNLISIMENGFGADRIIAVEKGLTRRQAFIQSIDHFLLGLAFSRTPLHDHHNSSFGT